MSGYQERTDRFTAVKDEYAGYTVRDPNGEKIGKVDDLFLNENDQPEYIGVKMGFFGTRGTLVPLDACTVDKSQGFIEVNQPKQTVKDAPNFDDGEITLDYKRQVREYYGLGAHEGTEDRGAYGSDGTDDSDASSVSVVEEEEKVVVGKRVVVKEEIRVRKDVVQDEEIVEEDVRKEEIDIDDPAERRAGSR